MNWGQNILVFAVRVYQRVISPALAGLFGPTGRCRFEPSCSQYAVKAIQIHGAGRGSALAAWRVCRCHPWGGCGFDPVPEKKFKVQSAVVPHAGLRRDKSSKFKVGEADGGVMPQLTGGTAEDVSTAFPERLAGTLAPPASSHSVTQPSLQPTAVGQAYSRAGSLFFGKTGSRAIALKIFHGS